MSLGRIWRVFARNTGIVCALLSTVAAGLAVAGQREHAGITLWITACICGYLLVCAVSDTLLYVVAQRRDTLH